MNDPREFDELARQKLAERQFAFKEGDWTDMQRLINDQGTKRRWPLWTIAALLLVATPTVWWALREEPASMAPASAAIAQEEEAAVKGTVSNSTASTSRATEQPDRTINDRAPEVIAPAEKVAVAEHAPGHQAHDRKMEVPAQGRPVMNSAPNTSQAKTGMGGSSGKVNVKTSNASTTAAVQAETPIAQQASAGTEAQASSGVVDQVTPPVAVNTSEVTPMNDVTAMPNASSTSATSTSMNTTSAENRSVVPPNGVTVTASSDSVQTTAGKQDSTLVPPAPAATNWLATFGSHFEFSILGGMSLSTGRYTSTSAETWRTDNSGQWSPIAGFEAMLMKEHFGLGLGVHRARYEEQLRAEQLSRTDDIYTTTYFLAPVQITTPVVIDTIQSGGVNYYVTTPTTVTVNQLMSNTDTTQQSTILREARTEVNRVDYWEVPLLADLHTSKGRWSFGVRGGPSIGFLSVRQGAVPNAEGDGYSDLAGSIYRSTLFGYQARIYTRYRLSDRWSIGLEPVVRGHFGNAFEGGSPVRRSMAVGGLFSLTFRLP